ncbi:Asp-tRNA(Asn)/Glu-tRNA(Gln) amidotransferase subunit GatA [Candidatus Woesearchaeota archaeon]|nr:Asp-tRNA(Asn)/Glu-tRNA(Gln) amidotransferase subunit GatA [Candidatus Woesearchaeota archaeon]
MARQHSLAQKAMSVAEFVKGVHDGQIDVVEHIHRTLEECKIINKEYGYLNLISEESAIAQAKLVSKKRKGAKGALAGLPVSIKDSICVKGVESTAGSAMLKGYIPPFDAGCVSRLRQAGAIIVGKTAQDEFGFGSFSTNTGIGFTAPKNPFDRLRSCGGSSGGAAGLAQKLSVPHVALGESTGGSIVNPASFCGVVGLCPTYGRVSRYGLIDYGSSLDKVGPIGKTVADVALALKVIAGFDEKESTTATVPVEDYPSFVKKDVAGLRVGILKESFGEGTDSAVEKSVWGAIKQLESAGVDCREISLKIPIEYGIPTYYIIAPSEASTNLAKLCGLRYGAEEKIEGDFNTYFSEVRSRAFGKEAKRRIMLGTFTRMAGYRDAYYVKATKVRRLIIDEYKNVFKKCDAVISPTVSILPPRFDEIKNLTPAQNYLIDALTVSPNLAGLPHLNMPVGKHNGLPIGAMLTTDHFKEGVLVQLGAALE